MAKTYRSSGHAAGSQQNIDLDLLLPPHLQLRDQRNRHQQHSQIRHGGQGGVGHEDGPVVETLAGNAGVPECADGPTYDDLDDQDG